MTDCRTSGGICGMLFVYNGPKGLNLTRTLTAKVYAAKIEVTFSPGHRESPRLETSESTPRESGNTTEVEASSGLKYYAPGSRVIYSICQVLIIPECGVPPLKTYGSWRQIELPSLSSPPGESRLGAECISNPTTILNTERLTGLKL